LEFLEAKVRDVADSRFELVRHQTCANHRATVKTKKVNHVSHNNINHGKNNESKTAQEAQADDSHTSSEHTKHCSH
jgi:hypothetical protein